MITVPELKSRITIPDAQESEYEALVTEVIDLWEEMTKRLWNLRSGHVQTIRLLDPKAKLLFLQLWPVSTITQIRQRDLDPLLSDWSIVATSDYVLQKPNIIERVGGSGGYVNRWWGDEVEITYDGGYSATTCPQDVKRALLIQAQFIQKRSAPGTVDLRSQAFEGGSTSYYEGFCHPMFMKLAKQKRRKA